MGKRVATFWTEIPWTHEPQAEVMDVPNLSIPVHFLNLHSQLEKFANGNPMSVFHRKSNELITMIFLKSLSSLNCLL